MTDRPIIFSAPMVRALLAGRKTQTRRIIKPQPIAPERWAGTWVDAGRERHAGCMDGERAIVRFEVGDRLWLREAWAAWMCAPCLPAGMGGELDQSEVLYKATDNGWRAMIADRDQLKALAAKREDGKTGNWVTRSPIHMPRWASRLTLTVTNVRVQRLCEISREDVIAEGITHRDGYPIEDCWWGWHEPFAQLWDKLHGDGAWSANPLVAALTFTVQHANIDQVAA